MIIGLTGKARSGKDTVASILHEVGFRKTAFADGLRDCMRALNPIIGVTSGGTPVYLNNVDLPYDTLKEEYPEYRRLLQMMGTEVGRRLIDPDLWVNMTMRRIDANRYGAWVITDVRFPNEYKAIREAGGTIVRILRAGSGLRGAHGEHESETALDGYDVDRTINNNASLDELRVEVLEKLFPQVKKNL